MAKQFARFEGMDNEAEMTAKARASFCDLLQQALLLALWERGTLTMIQHRHAEEALRRQRLERAGNL